MVAAGGGNWAGGFQPRREAPSRVIGFAETPAAAAGG